MHLRPDFLVPAYAHGVFPMDVDGRIEWFSPDPRTILPLERFKPDRDLARLRRCYRLEIRINAAFLRVLRHCADRTEGTWISEEIVAAYCDLYRLGLAHSVEVWQDGALAGGLYGVALGGAFFGESMFHLAPDAGKIALASLVERLRLREYVLLDVQFMTEHLRRVGAVEIPRHEYLRRLAGALRLVRRFDDDAQGV